MRRYENHKTALLLVTRKTLLMTLLITAHSVRGLLTTRTPARNHGFKGTLCSRLYGARDASKQNQNLWTIEKCMDRKNDIKFIDGSWYHKGSRNGRQEFEAGPRIPGANYLDMDDIATSKELFPELNPKGLRVMFPPPSLFAATMDAMEIQPDDQVVVYGRQGCWFTPRTWYLFKTYGHENVALMQGSLEDWIQMGGPVDNRPIQYNLWAKDLVPKNNLDHSSKYPVSSNAKARFWDMDQVLDSYNSTVIVDTRGSGYVTAGHIPGACHIPYASLVEVDNPLRLKPRKELEEILNSHGIPKDEPILLSCGSGVSVCHMALVLEECGYPAPFVYDGSWNEWGSDPDTPKTLPQAKA